MIMEKLSFLLTPGNVSDSKLDVVLKLAQKLYGRLFGDRGYISSGLFETLYNNRLLLEKSSLKSIE